MKLDINGIYHGFAFIEKREVSEINSTAFLFKHNKSGALLLYLHNDDDNKVFSISFRTPPGDNTGIPHILEHSALCGSRKFPSKEPFIELAKGSLNTFLNAMTFSDKTMYPVASRNEKDFANLMDVYLDAVFHPNIYDYPEIFMQEGWHYELESGDKELEYRGVVFNEMKGVFSTPEAVLFRKIPESLFPDTTYSFESGGDPDFIPDLTYEQFIDFHRHYYHPANSYIFLYGDGDILEHLSFLDDGYLGEFDHDSVDSAIGLQQPFSQQKELQVNYPILPHEDEGEKTYLSLNFVVDRATNPELMLAFTILEYLLIETPAAPLKKSLQDAGIGKDVFGSFERDLFQPIFSIVLKNSSADRKDEFQQNIIETLRSLVKDGIDKKMVEAAINIHEFKLREADFRGLPKGLVYCMAAMNSWLYEGDPLVHLAYEKTLATIKQALHKNYFEELIQRYLLDNTHRSLLVVAPEKGLAERKITEEQEKLNEYRKGLGDEQIDEIVKGTAELRKRQITPDSPEDLKKIPLLSLSDVNREAEHLPLEEGKQNDVKVLYHPVFTSGIAYVNMMFDASAVGQEDISYIPLLTGVLGRVSTKQYSYADLSNQILINTGGINFGAESYGDKDDDTTYDPRLLLKSKALIEKLPSLFDLIGEIIGRTRFDEPKRFKEIVQEMKSRFEMGLYDRGHFMTASRLLSYFSPRGWYAEMLGGISNFQFISQLEREFDKKADEIMHNLQRIAGLIFNRENLLISVTASKEDLKSFRETFPRVLPFIGESKADRPGSDGSADYSFDGEASNEGLLTPGKVQYVAKGYNFRKLGYQYRGSLQVLSTIASLDYLWNRIRVQGGAYGSFARFSRDGNMYFCSYRDPNLSETLKVYDEAGDYFRNIDIESREITKYIIGTVSRLDHPLTPSMKGEAAADRYMRNIDQDDVQKVRDEILSTGKKQIRECADLIVESMKQDYVCVLGNEGKLKENEKLFGKLVQVFS